MWCLPVSYVTETYLRGPVIRELEKFQIELILINIFMKRVYAGKLLACFFKLLVTKYYMCYILGAIRT